MTEEAARLRRRCEAAEERLGSVSSEPLTFTLTPNPNPNPDSPSPSPSP